MWHAQIRCDIHRREAVTLNRYECALRGVGASLWTLLCNIWMVLHCSLKGSPCKSCEMNIWIEETSFSFFFFSCALRLVRHEVSSDIQFIVLHASTHRASDTHQTWLIRLSEGTSSSGCLSVVSCASAFKVNVGFCGGGSRTSAVFIRGRRSRLRG